MEAGREGESRRFSRSLVSQLTGFGEAITLRREEKKKKFVRRGGRMFGVLELLFESL